ncbi:PREDICTED: mutS protein homolog 5-like [Ceratosolen solmsi marchali]|uniref:MutS protein homolog 5-like n=1 Tax=Ceratosolen solmsi marchali TaxID=326594 RepID=A0AAJ6YQY6_9HYME|nr:PREDICTED: mutS protein homolog 5-like [Ceratosolen solmsi marchali]
MPIVHGLGIHSVFLRLPITLSSISPQNLQSLPSEIENCHLVYIPEVGYVIAVTKWRILLNYRTIPSIQYKFSANGVDYFKSTLTTELDRVLGDVNKKIRKRSARIILKLSHYIKYYSEGISDAIKKCAELDALISFYQVAHNQHYVRPQIVNEHKILIYGGRHPLIEQTTTFIPNDTLSENNENLIKIITGPNSCGKSTFIKQTALIVFMAHIGSYVPAKFATIGLLSHIYTKITCSESISLQSSFFLQDIRQASRALSSSSKKSLIIIDEFGKGTSKMDSIALLSAIIIEFINKGTECPHVLIVTYFCEIFEWIPESNLVKFQTFEFLMDKNNVLFLYRLIKGQMTCNYSFVVAQITYLNNYIFNFAKEIQMTLQFGEAPPRPNDFRRKELSLASINALFSSETVIVLTDLKGLVLDLMGDQTT